MINELKFVTESAKFFIKNFIQPGDIVIDATCGNGNDTLFLSNEVKENGKVFAIDIQEKAINKTRELLKREAKFNNVELIKEDHQNLNLIIPEYFSGQISVIMFNLGYLPESDHLVMTSSKKTVQAIEKSLTLLKTPGLITICTYPHKEGLLEAEEINKKLSELTGDYNAYELKRLNRNNPPYLLLITKG